MAILHLINKSPFTHTNLTQCLNLSQPDSSILLLEDGVYATTDHTPIADIIRNHSKQQPFYALLPDLEARGLHKQPLISSIELIDYPTFVRLTIEYNNVQSWP